MKALVTGATGFIGSHLTRALLDAGCSVTAAVRSPDTAASNPVFKQTRRVQFDLERLPPDNLWHYFQQPDIVFHMAWEGLPNYGSSHHLEENLPRHLEFLRRLAKDGIPKVVVSGTCAEYGKQYGPLAEDSQILPTSRYATAKHVLHLMIRPIFEDCQSRLIWVRLFYVVGTPGRNSLFDQLADAIAQKKPSIDLTGGEQLLDFLPVEDVAANLVKIGEKIDRGTVLNLGRGEPTSVRRIVEALVAETGSDLTLNWGRIPYSGNESMAFWADVTRLNRLFS